MFLDGVSLYKAVLGLRLETFLSVGAVSRDRLGKMLEPRDTIKVMRHKADCRNTNMVVVSCIYVYARRRL